LRSYSKGLTLSIIIAVVAMLGALYIPIGGVALAIIIGMIIGNIVNLNESYSSGITYAEKTLLAYAIALMGIDLDFGVLSALGIKTVGLIIVSMIFTIFITLYIAKYFKLDDKFSLMLGIGNGVCGASAISATAPIVKADKNSVGISIAVVNLLGTVGIFLVPAIAFVFGLSEIDAGILIGNTLQAVGQVTAAGFSVSDTAGVSATAVKMGRVLLLTPLVFILLYLYHKNNTDSQTSGAKVPGFIIVFVLLSIISSLNLVNEDIKIFISTLSSILLVVAMAAIGLKIHFKSVKDDGKLALKIASIVFLLQILFTLVILWV
jgi:uncharacterized integral membrane protein (TIGR00698 family)